MYWLSQPFQRKMIQRMSLNKAISFWLSKRCISTLSFWLLCHIMFYRRTVKIFQLLYHKWYYHVKVESKPNVILMFLKQFWNFHSARNFEFSFRIRMGGKIKVSEFPIEQEFWVPTSSTYYFPLTVALLFLLKTALQSWKDHAYVTQLGLFSFQFVFPQATSSLRAQNTARTPIYNSTTIH